MTQSSPLISLAERCENEAAGSRELDVLIRAEIDNRDVIWNGNLMLGRHRNPPHDECRLGSIDPGKLSRNFSIAWSVPECPYYTTSLDAALTLVPEGMEIEISNIYGTARAGVGLNANEGPFYAENKAADLCLALSAAALRALAATEL